KNDNEPRPYADQTQQHMERRKRRQSTHQSPPSLKLRFDLDLRVKEMRRPRATLGTQTVRVNFRGATSPLSLLPRNAAPHPTPNRDVFVRGTFASQEARHRSSTLSTLNCRLLTAPMPPPSQPSGKTPAIPR